MGSFDHGAGALVHIGRGGWTIHWLSLPESHSRNCRTEHYGETWRDHLGELAADCVIVDTTTIPEDDIVAFAFAAPMVNVDLPAGMVENWGDRKPWDPTPRTGAKDPRTGNARGMDYAATDVYAAIAERFGAKVQNVRDLQAVAA